MIAFFRDLLELGKSNITMLVVMTTIAGFVLGEASFLPWQRLLWVVVGTAFISGGASVFNHYIERDLDKLMPRTANRPLSSGRLSPKLALAYGSWLTVVGVVVLALLDRKVMVLGLIAWASYLFVYTPLKRKSWLATLAGTIPGAVPPLMGWVAATGELSAGGWILFGLLFCWQMPHSYSIAWLCRDQYEAAGMPLLSVGDPEGKRTGAQTLGFTVALVLVSLAPWFFDLGGLFYTVGAALLGAWFLWLAWTFTSLVSNPNARKLMLYSVGYLPAVLLLLVVDRLI